MRVWFFCFGAAVGWRCGGWIMGKVIFIVSGGAVVAPAFFRQQAAKKRPAAIICADGGARRLDELGRIPDLIVGDMDSLDSEAQRRCEAKGCRIVRHARRKDETDTELALREAFRMGPTEVWIWGALGHRVDHTRANISLLFQGREKGIGVKLIDRWCDLFLAEKRWVLEGEAGQTVSLFPFAGPVTGITLTGFEYPLKAATMEVGRPYGISNRLTSKRGIIEMDSGLLLVVRYFRPGVFPGEGEE